MARLLVERRWFKSVGSHSWYERDFEGLVVEHAEMLFPEWICVSFTETVEGDDGVRKKPDLALIDRAYRQWWVVEIELAHHDLNNHVLPQVRAFATGRYDARHVAALKARHEALNRDRLQAMMMGLPPRVLVIADTPAVTTRWSAALHELGVSLATVEPFRGPNNELILRLNGEVPEPPGAALSRCSRHPLLARFWRVHSPAALPDADDDVLAITYQGETTGWKRVAIHDGLMLGTAGRGDPLEGLDLVDLVRSPAGDLAFVPVVAKRRERRRHG